MLYLGGTYTAGDRTPLRMVGHPDPEAAMNTHPTKAAAATSIFTRNQSASFLVIPKEESTGLREVARYYAENGRVPGLTARSRNGFPVGKWLAEAQRVPHRLSESTRAFLLCIPGMWLSSRPVGPRNVGHPRTKAEEALFRRLMLWAEDPMKDPVTARALRGRMSVSSSGAPE